jgi:copper homeostasis protein
MLLEVVVFNFQSALMAAAAGAHRIELCDNYYEGGTTPSFGNVTLLKEKLEIPIFPMVRPRGGDFLYNNEELMLMEKEIQLFRQLGCEGVVLGCLEKDGTINNEALSKFTEIAYPMEVTFHRAFDRVKDHSAALETIIDCGCKRILTSGGKPLAIEGVNVIKELVDQASNRITIIAGGGVSSNNIARLMETGAQEFHSPARKTIASEMEFKNEDMHENLGSAIVDEEEIKRMLEILKESPVYKPDSF